VPSQSPVFAFRAAAPRFAAVLAYAVAMAYVEAAAVVYLRTIYGGIDPVQPRQTPFDPLPDLLGIEVGREAATVVMLATVGWLAAPRGAGRLGAFVAAFGAWDIFYYVFLWLFTGWPAGPLAPDILFLIPLTWWGPVISPVLIALLMVVYGGLVLARDLGSGLPPPDRWAWAATVAGAAVCLGAFMADALLDLAGRSATPLATPSGTFPWPLYLAGLALGALGCYRIVAARAARLKARPGQAPTPGR